ncbi:MAG: VCBS repeat-containing protein [Pyrinomonadaceae bacterium]|nr:VCBS repeat-containing protein [Pyrinomonadaceae bacterium]
MKKNIAFLAVVFLFSTIFVQAAGELDPGFGHVGFKTISFTNGLDRARAILRQPDGKIVLVGNRNDESGSAITLVRFNPDGTLDSSFGTGGSVLDENGQANAAVLQPDGKIVVTGKISSITGTFFAVIRYNPNGTLDSTFATGGKLTDTVNFLGNSIAVQPDGKIVVGGTGKGSTIFDDFAAARINSNGTYDTSFDGDGKAFTNVGEQSANDGNDIGTSVAIQTDGKIVIGGIAPFTATGRDFAIVRYNVDGSLDTSFDGDGIFHTSLAGASQMEILRSIELDGFGRIIAVGSASEAVAESSFALIRLNSDGNLDTTFSGDGKLLIKTRGNTFEEANDVVIHAGNKILIAGSSGYSAVDLALVRFNDDGSLDNSFGSGGVVYTRISEELDGILNALGLAPNGDIVAGGSAQNSAGGEDFVFAKYSANGVPTPAFGVPGYVLKNLFDNNTTSYEGKSVALQADGRLVVAGNFYSNTGASNGFVARLDRNGSLDRNFNNQSGFLTINSPSADEREITAVAVQPDGKIVVVGNYEGSSDFGIFVSRFNSNGTPDTTFGSSGVAVISIFSGGGLGQDIAILPNGKIAIAGASVNIFTQLAKFAVFRLTANGSLDSTFGSGGVSSTSFSASNDVALSLAVQADGKLVAAGSGNFDLGSNGLLAAARFNTNGSLDTSFGTGGKISSDIGPAIDLAADVKIQTDGKVVVGGVTCTDANCGGGNALIFRYNSNGAADTSFNGNGRVFVQPVNSGAPTAISGIAIQNDGKIVGAGAVQNSGSGSDALIVRYLSNGAPDSSFGQNGIVEQDINNTEQIAYSIAVQPDGKLVATGSHLAGTQTELAVWRFLGENQQALSPVKFDFDGDRKSDVGIFRPAQGEWWYLRSGNGGNAAFSFGTSNDKLAPADFTGDGKTDVAFWRESTGEWFILRSENGSFYSFVFGTTGDIPMPADYDGDGIADPAIFRPSNATWYVLRSTGGILITQFGAAGDEPVAADYDGDGKDDMAIFRPSTGEWWINRSTAGIAVYNFGLSSDLTVPADFTGDGKADVAFWRPSTGEWFVLRSEDGSFYSFAFGTAGDVPAVGDFDGDGRADPTVFRPSNRVWYKLQSTNGFSAITFGAPGDIPVHSAFNR